MFSVVESAIKTTPTYKDRYHNAWNMIQNAHRHPKEGAYQERAHQRNQEVISQRPKIESEGGAQARLNLAARQLCEQHKLDQGDIGALMIDITHPTVIGSDLGSSLIHNAILLGMLEYSRNNSFKPRQVGLVRSGENWFYAVLGPGDVTLDEKIYMLYLFEDSANTLRYCWQKSKGAMKPAGTYDTDRLISVNASRQITDGLLELLGTDLTEDPSTVTVYGN